VRNFFLSFPIPQSSTQLVFGDKVLFLGSCFSDEMASKASYYGLNAHTNPFGTIFHPIPLGRFIVDTINGNLKERSFQNQNDFYSWDASTILSSKTEEELHEKITEIRKEWKVHLSTCNVLFITLGTSWGYWKNEIVVANCHKRPSYEFSKQLSSVQEIVAYYRIVIETLKKCNPSVKIIFTVSPVRHVRDGLIENNQSKSVLIEVIRQLTKLYDVQYFPSYEIVIDELRDYRFYSKDLVHPSQEAIDYVWERMIDIFCSESTKTLMKKIDGFRKLEQHRPINMSEEQMGQHKMRISNSRAELIKENPEILL
jgi:hypothetical protein